MGYQAPPIHLPGHATTSTKSYLDLSILISFKIFLAPCIFQSINNSNIKSSTAEFFFYFPQVVFTTHKNKRLSFTSFGWNYYLLYLPKQLQLRRQNHQILFPKPVLNPLKKAYQNNGSNSPKINPDSSIILVSSCVIKT